MKKIFTAFLSLLLAVMAAVPAFAGADLARAESADMESFAAEVQGGTHLFDAIGALSDSEQQYLENRLQQLEQQSGQSAVIVIVENNQVSEDLERYADHLYQYGGLGTGSDRDGVLVVLDLGDEAHRGVQIYANGGAMRYFTDRAIDQILNSYGGGGMLSPLKNGAWYEALSCFTDAADQLYAQGVQEGQYNYNPETGEKDYYYKKTRSFKVWHFLVAALIAGLAGFIPMQSVRSKYAMKKEKRQAQSLNVAYRTTSAFAFAPAADVLVGEHTVHVPIPRPQNNSGSGHSSFGGGRSTMHSSGGGGFHTSGGAKF